MSSQGDTPRRDGSDYSPDASLDDTQTQEQARSQEQGWTTSADSTLRGRISSLHVACVTTRSRSRRLAATLLARGRDGGTAEGGFWSRGFSIFASVLLVLSLATAPIAVASADDLGALFSIPSSTAGVDREYNDTYRVIANNDEDVSLDDISYSGYFENDYPLGPTHLRESTRRPGQTLRYTATQDLYITDIADFADVPVADEWIPYENAPAWADTQFIAVHTNNTYEGPTSNDGEWFVFVTDQYGKWRPVYHADVAWDENAEELYVANPGEALIHDSDRKMLLFRNIHAADQYSRYSQDSDRVAIPIMNGRELYPTSSGASMPREWGQGSYSTVRDAWVGITNVWGGVWYRDSYVIAGAPTRGAYVSYDHRAVAPPDYSYDDQCRVRHIHRRTHTHDNSTHTHTSTHWHYYDRTKWAEYELLNSSANVTSVRLDRSGFSGQSEWTRETDTIWSAQDYTTGTPFYYPRGRYTLTATLEVTTEVETRWGISSSRCNSWSRSSTDTYTHTTTYSVPVTITDGDSPNLNVTVVHIDGAGDDRIAIIWEGDQDLTGDPWESIDIEIGDKDVRITSPWRFYGVSRNNEVQVRTASGTTTHNVTHSEGDRWPAIYRFQTSVANVTASVPQQEAAGQRWGWIEPVDSQVATTLPGAPLPAGVNDPDNDAPTELYQQQVFTVRTNDLDTDETASATVDNSFKSVLDASQVTVYSKPYDDTVLQLIEVSPSPTGEDHEGTLILTNASHGFLEGKELTVVQGDGTTWTVTTDADGRAPITWDGMVVRAYYEGDVFVTDPGAPYYRGDKLIHLLPPGEVTFSAVGTVGEYISRAINNTLIFVEWLALGTFALWYVRMRRRTIKRGGGKKA